MGGHFSDTSLGMQAAWGGIIGSFGGVLEPPSDHGADVVRSLSALERASQSEQSGCKCYTSPLVTSIFYILENLE